jgi:hypothetical protein
MDLFKLVPTWGVYLGAAAAAIAILTAIVAVVRAVLDRGEHARKRAVHAATEQDLEFEVSAEVDYEDE